MAGVSRGRMAARARSAIGYLSMLMRSGTLTEVARRFGRDVTTMSKGVQRLTERVEGSKTESRRLMEILR